MIPSVNHDDVIKYKLFPRYWPFVGGIHRSPVNSPDKGQWRGTLMFPLICAWINGWVNNREAGDLRRHRAHYDVTLMITYSIDMSHKSHKHLPHVSQFRTEMRIFLFWIRVLWDMAGTSALWSFARLAYKPLGKVKLGRRYLFLYIFSFLSNLPQINWYLALL